tara:strand:- start:3150 stop:3497 length:348 start_codon:yes stop_codon:yes gene_type:complete
MDSIPIAEGIVGLIAGVGAWLSWKANAAANKASREAEGANKAVNCNENPDAPRLYEIASNNAKLSAVIEERVDGIRDRGKVTEKKVDVLVVTQAEHSETLKHHGVQLERQTQRKE